MPSLTVTVAIRFPSHVMLGGDAPRTLNAVAFEDRAGKEFEIGRCLWPEAESIMLPRPERPINLLVRLYRPETKQALASSAVHYAVRSDLAVAIDYPDPLAGRPEYDRAVAALAPWLGGRALAALPAEERAALPASSGIDGAVITRLAEAQRAAAELETLLGRRIPSKAEDAKPAEAPPTKPSRAAVRGSMEDALRPVADKARPPDDLPGRTTPPSPGLDLVAALYALARPGMDQPLAALLLHSRNSLLEALRRAADDKIIADPSRTASAQIVEILVEARNLLLLNLDDDGRFAIAKGVAATRLDPAAKSRLLDGLLDKADPEAALAATDGLLDEDKASVRETFALFEAVGRHAPMLAALTGAGGGAGPALKRGRIDGGRLQALGAESLRTLAADAGVPKVYRNRPDGAADYAADIATALEQRAPGQALAARLASSDLPGSTAMSRLIAGHPGFDIRTMPVQSYFAGPGADSPDQPSAAQLGRLQSLQRAVQVAPDGDLATAERVLAGGYDSAFSMLVDGKAAVQQKLAPTLGAATALDIYRNAQQVFAQGYATALAGASQWGRSTGLLSNALASGPQLPNLTTLFGSGDYCLCAHCQSVYGPAAYLADLLGWMLRDVICPDPVDPLAPPHSAYAALVARRPDIPRILLNCGNAETSMPYIDRVIEILSYSLLPPGTGPDLGDLQTHGSSEERLTEPEHRAPFAAADALLLGANVRWTLPYDPVFDEARLYLEALKVPHPRLVAALSASDWTARSADERIAWACARFGLIPEQFLLITSPHGGPGFWTLHWGLAAAPGAAVKPLLDTGEFADLAALEAVLGTHMARGQQQGEFPFDRIAFPPDAPCDVDKARLARADGSDVALPETVADRIMRFERLRRRAGLSVAELNQALLLFGPGGMDAGFVCRLAAASSAADMLAMPFGRMLGWLAGSTEAHREMAAALGIGEADLDAAIQLLSPAASPLSQGPEATLQFLQDLEGLRSIPIPPAELLAMLEGSGAWALDDRGRPVGKELADAAKQAWEEVKAAVGAIAGPPAAPGSSAPSASALAAAKSARTAAFNLTLANSVGLPLLAATQLIDDYKPAISTAPSSVSPQEPESVGTAMMRGIFENPGPPPSLAGGNPLAKKKGPASAPPRHADADFPDLYRYLLRASRLFRALGVDPESARLLAQLSGLGAGPAAPVALRYPVALDILANRFAPGAGPSARSLIWARAAILEAKALAVSTADFLAYAQLLSTSGPVNFGNWAVAEMGPSSVLAGRSSVDLNGLAAVTYSFDPTGDLVVLVRRILDLAGLERDLRLPVSQISVLVWNQFAQQGSPAQPNRFSSAQVAALRGALVSDLPGDSERRARLRPIQDRGRRNLRDALVAYYLGQRGFADANALYAHFLIDPEMQPCMLTSRIVEATLACHLIIQRGLLGLEPEVRLDENDKKEWTWRSAYRVWEANRKVFLYPENWIEPELRLVKTPFFAEAQERLLQDELNTANVEKVFGAYLARLEEVSRLDIRAVYYDDEEKVSHVFGRGWNPPHKHYHRSQGPDRRWSAWTEIPIDIEGDHLIPVVFNRRLYLFWPTFTPKEHRTLKMTPVQGTPYVELRLCFSKLEFGKWTSKKQADKFWIAGRYSGPSLFDSIEERLAGYWTSSGTSVNFPHHLDPAAFYFWAEPSDSDLVIHVRRLLPGSNHSYSHEVDLVIGGCDEQLSFRKPAPPVLSHGWPDYVAEPFPVERDGMLLRSERNWTGSFLNLRLDNSYTFDPTQFQLLAQTHAPYSLTFAHQDHDALPIHPFFLSDRRHTHLITYRHVPFDGSINFSFEVELHEHPHCCLMMRELNRLGVDGLLAPQDGATANPLRRQQLDQTYFHAVYEPHWTVTSNATLSFDFGYFGAYSAYNWEIFFHLPALIARQLRLDGKHEEAIRWLSFVFDPTNREESLGTPRFWMFNPFHAYVSQGSIAGLMQLLQSSAPQDQPRRQAFAAQIAAWQAHPFEPHAIAGMRIEAYMRWTVMEYIETLIDWGDKLFARDSMESVNEALMLYTLAAEILGRRPRQVSGAKPAERSFADLSASLDDFSNAAAELEDLLPAVGGGAGSAPVSPTALYFCIPENPQLLAYWDRVADRLFKIHHCQNLRGEARVLALFAPPIDPALLVRAVASGLDLSEVLDSLAGPGPRHRFAYVLQRAMDFTNDVKSLGAQLLAVLEKHDAEALADLSKIHELNLLGAARSLRKFAVEEAKQSVASANQAKAMAETRLAHYSNLEFMIAEESSAKALTEAAHLEQDYQQQMMTLAAALGIINFQIGSSGNGVHATFAFELAKVPALQAQVSGAKASAWLNESGRALTAASYKRRAEDWKLQRDLAEREVEQADKQVLAAEIRLAMAEKELDIHDLEVAQAKEMRDWMRSKFTGEALYGSMAGRLKTLHRQAYKLAFNLALQAQRAFQIELGRSETFVEFGAWDSRRQGLLAGEILGGQLRELEAAYMQYDSRDFDLTRSVSLRLLDPAALMALRSTGQAQFTIPAWLLQTLFEDDLRLYAMRLKSVAVSLSSVTGPYTPTQLRLRLLQSGIGWSPADDPEADFRASEGPSDIITSTAVNDPALFEATLRDERYLPFENAGAVSKWAVSLPRAAEFDHQTIADLILHLRFVAKGAPAPAATPAANPAQPALLMSWRQDFPDQWASLATGLAAGQASFPLPMPGLELLPYRLRLAAAGKILKPELAGWAQFRQADGERALGDLAFQPGAQRKLAVTIPTGESGTPRLSYDDSANKVAWSSAGPPVEDIYILYQAT